MQLAAELGAGEGRVGVGHHVEEDAPVDPPADEAPADLFGTIAGNVDSLEVRGTVSDDSGAVASVTVNDVSAAVAADGTFSVTVPVTANGSSTSGAARDV